MNRLQHSILFLGLVLTTALVGCTRNGMPKKQSNARSHVDHLIIKEVFYVGHYWQRDTRKYGFKGKNLIYDDDQYLTIYNPTEETKYLDGLAIASTALDPSGLLEFAPKDNFVNHYYGAGTLMCFPGKGQDYPLRPHQSVVVAKYAIDHKADFIKVLEEDNDGEPVDLTDYRGLDAFLDLRKADFEWTNRNYLSEDNKRRNNPDVPDLEPILVEKDKRGNPAPAYTFNYIAERGGIALLRLPWTKDDFQKNHRDTKDHRGYVHYITITSSNFADFYVIEIPFSQMIDCVTICPKQEFKQRTTKLDRGFNAVTERASKSMPDSEYPKFSGNALIRRWDGRKFVDDDNTTVDFQVKTATLSRLDAQGNAIK